MLYIDLDTSIKLINILPSEVLFDITDMSTGEVIYTTL